MKKLSHWYRPNKSTSADRYQIDETDTIPQGRVFFITKHSGIIKLSRKKAPNINLMYN